MTENLAPELTAALPAAAAMQADLNVAREVNIIAALLEALSAPEHHRLTERGGELYVAPAADAVRSMRFQ